MKLLERPLARHRSADRLGGLCQASLRRARPGPLLRGALHLSADRQAHRVATTNVRLLALEDETVDFRLNEYRPGHRLTTLTLAAGEFIRRFHRRARRPIPGLSPRPPGARASPAAAFPIPASPPTRPRRLMMMSPTSVPRLPAVLWLPARVHGGRPSRPPPGRGRRRPASPPRAYLRPATSPHLRHLADSPAPRAAPPRPLPQPSNPHRPPAVSFNAFCRSARRPAPAPLDCRRDFGKNTSIM